MKSLIDNKLLRVLIADQTEGNCRNFLEACSKAKIIADAEPLQITFAWPSLLEYIGFGSIFQGFPEFDEQNELFRALISSLAVDAEKDILVRLYDQVFVECLTQVKALPQIQPSVLLSKIQEKRPFSLFSQAVDRYEKVLMENPRHALHDLILYLAWDRVCANLTIVFDHNSPELKNRKGLDVLKECLLESFQHITEQGRTAPGFFRLVEALYAYQMREEKLQSYTDAEWTTLSQSARALAPREELSDVPYIDAAGIVCPEGVTKTKELLRVFTMDSEEKVKSGHALAQFMIEKLKLETPEWRYTLCPVEVVCIKEGESGLYVDVKRDLR